MDITWIEALLWISLLSFPAAFLLTIGSKSPSLEKLEVLFKIQSINNLDKIKTTSDHCLIHLDKISLDEQLIDVGTTIEIPSGFHQAYTVNVNQHYKFWNSYLEKRWDMAIVIATSLRTAWDGEMKTYYDVMIGRCKHYKTNPPPANWNGVYVK